MSKLDRGIRHHRTEDKSLYREKAFADEWEKENEKDLMAGYRGSLLQRLFIDGDINHEHIIKKITKRDRMIAATVIQWLGSNIGFCFLETVLKKSGYTLIKSNNKHENS